MKTINTIFAVSILALFTACVFETTPGRDGVDNNNGSLLGSVFEVKGDFKPSNEFSLLFSFPSTFKVYDSDIILVYILWEQTKDQFGKMQDVWRLLPQTVVLNEGVLQYNFDYTQKDVRIFLGGSIDLNKLLPAEALDQVFRVVVLPADFALYNSLDLKNFGLVLKAINVQPGMIQRMELPEIPK
jgi:hypothetical protein